MSNEINPIRQGFHTVTPCLVVKDADKAIKYYARVFGAKENYGNYAPDGKSIMYAEIKIGDSIITLSEEFPKMNSFAPSEKGRSPVSLYLYVENADEIYNRALSEGGETIFPMSDAFWGDRYGQLKDPYGHIWSIATHKKDVSPE
jgi:PhnB protein